MLDTLRYIFLMTVLLYSCAAKEPSNTSERECEPDIEMLKGYQFINLNADTINDHAGSMNDFYALLKKLKSKNNDSDFNQVHIIHYGDSHIQAGYMTEIVRRRLQTMFGNAGRGLVVPLKLAGTNEPRDYTITSNGNYTAAKITEKGTLAVTPGIGGFALRNTSPKQIFKISTHQVPEDTINYRFSRIVVFHDSLAPMVTADTDKMTDDFGSDILYNYTTAIDLINPTDSIQLYTFPQKQFSDGAFYGFSLENSNNGVIYHSLGVNGACYVHWGGRNEAIIQSQALNPKLIIVSMGANEAAGHNFVEEVFYKEVHSFVSKLKEANPSCAILLTAPAEAMRKTRKGNEPNVNYQRIANTLAKYAADNNMAFFDIFNAMGGVNSSLNFDKAGILRPDKIHFTPEGYTLQGLMIYNALLNGYNKYVRENR